MLMRRFFIYFSLFSALFFCINDAKAQSDDYPTISPTATYTDADSDEPEETTEKSGSAPVVGVFRANPENTTGWAANYEWRFSTESKPEPYLIRYEEDTEVTFTKAGSHLIVCYATFVQGNDTISYGAEYWQENTPLRCTVSESKLEMPNAFSPNGDGINDIYQAKNSYRSLVEFHAYIYNRWGQLLFDWTNPAEGWDGTHNGKPVKEGVYYVLVKAKGADGIKYNIKRDVNLLRGYREGDSYTE